MSAARVSVNRRSFLGAMSGALGWPAFAKAQLPQRATIGFLNSGSPRTFAHLVEAFRAGLEAGGYVAGRNVAIDYRWAEGHYDDLRTMAIDLVQRNVTLIAATGGVVSAQAALKATTTIPIVFVVGFDPVQLGLVASLHEPGGNATGVTISTTELASKRLELLKDFLPNTESVGLLVNPRSVATDIEKKDTAIAAHLLRLKHVTIEATTESDLDQAFHFASQEKVGALLVSADPFFTTRRARLVALAAQHGLPTIYPFGSYVEAGGLMSYGAELPWAYRQAGYYAARILKGDKPTKLPVMRPATFDLIINLKTAKALGISVPPQMLARAHRVVE